ncbi:coiled-coil domain-containing protein 7 [Rhinolophus sinicus]|uniref:coiled-coil domain-containing protein 7 n=1 Tax=Rhinolophus sinicus TaxID=89399 RepID=UPI003D79DCEE
MKPVKHLSAYSNKLTSVPELSYKKRLFNSPLSPKPKEKHSVKVVRDKLEPMVLRSPPTGESVVRFALPIPSSKTKELIAEDELLRKITKHLKMVVSSLEETYGVSTENAEKPVVKPEHEKLSFSVGDDLHSFLLCCSQLAAQLEEAVEEEHHILESLFKWFQQQVNQVEELSKGQSFLEVEYPTSDKEVTLNIAQVGKHAKKLEELKDRLREGSRFSLKSLMSSSVDSKNAPEAMQGCENIQQKIEEFIKTHSTEEFRDVFAPEPQTAYSVSNQLTAMLKIFEKQSNMLNRTRNDQVLLETKYKQMESDFQMLSEEKLMLENELQKLKNTEKTKPTHDQTKKTMKTEKKYTKGKSEDSEEKKSPVKELKIQEDFLKAQEAETAKLQLKHFLNQGELLKSEEMTHTTMERTVSKIEIKGEDLKYIPMEKETKKAQVVDSSGQDTKGKIQEHPQISVVHNGSPIENRSEKKRASPAISDLSQFRKSQDGSVFVERSHEVSAHKDLSPIPPSKSPDKSFARVLSSKEIQDLLSVGTLLPGNESVTTSFVSPPVAIERKSMDSGISKVFYNISIFLVSRLNASLYVALDKVPYENHENLTLEDEMLLTLPKQMLEQKSFSLMRRKAIFVDRQNDMISDENQLSEDMDLFLRSQSQTKNLEATRNETFSKPSDHQCGLKGYYSLYKSGPNMYMELITTQDDVTDKKLLLEQQDSTLKTQMQVKKQRTSEKERYIIHDGVPDENLMLMHEDSMSEKEMQVEKQMTSKDAGLITQDQVPDESRMLEHQGSPSKSEIQMNQRIYKGEGLNDQDMNKLSDESFTFEDLELASQRLSGMYDTDKRI